NLAERHLIAQFERGVDGGMAEAAAGIRLDLISVIHEVVARAKAVERFGRPGQAARKTLEITELAFERPCIRCETARAEHGGEYRIVGGVSAVQGLGHAAEINSDATCQRRRDPDDVSNVLALDFQEPCASGGCRDHADGAGGVPAANAPSFVRCAI